MARILCIEDDRDLLEDLVEELTEARYDVLQAGDGQQGLWIIKRYQPELVISDISMPGMNGYELLREVRERNLQLAQTPFIFLSALAARDERIKGLNCGADDYLTKPVDYDVLVSKVGSILRMRQRMRKQFEEDTARLVERFRYVYDNPSSETDDEVVWQ